MSRSKYAPKKLSIVNEGLIREIFHQGTKKLVGQALRLALQVLFYQALRPKRKLFHCE